RDAHRGPVPVPVGTLSDVWVPLPGDPHSFYNATRHRELVAAGLVPKLPQTDGRRPTVARKRSKHTASWKELTGNAVADYLLEHTTIADKMWTKAKRRKGESRSDFVKRQLLKDAA